jgi:hypothetical protein
MGGKTEMTGNLLLFVTETTLDSLHVETVISESSGKSNGTDAKENA